MALEQNAPPVTPAQRRFPTFVGMQLALDLAECAAVLLLFLLFVNRMLPRLVDLVLIERAHPELILLAAGINAQALLLVPANRGVKARGLYRVVRHPIYAGYTLTHIGFLLGFPSLQNAALYAGIFAIEVMRLLPEEAVLKRDPAYTDYAARLRYRLLPGVF